MSDLRSRIRQRIDELTQSRGGKVSLRSISLASGLSEWSLSKILKTEDDSPTLDTITRLAIGLETSPVWLAFGEAPKPKVFPTLVLDPIARPDAIRVNGLVGAGARVEQIGNPASWDAPETIGLPLGPHVAALLVRGDSQFPRFFDGEFVIYDTRARLPADLIDRFSIVETLDGRRLIKTIREGTDDIWLLESLNAPSERVKLLAAYEYLGTVANPAEAAQTKPQTKRKKKSKY